MKKLLITMSILIMSAMTLSSAPKNDNPFFKEYKTPFGVPPFDQIKLEHYMPAFEEGMKQQEKEISAIITKKSQPTFQSVIEPLERSGSLLKKVSSVFYNMMSANTNSELQKLAQELSPKMSKHGDDIVMNKQLFDKIKIVYDNKDNAKLTKEQFKLLEKTYKNFVRSGAALNSEQQKRLREINQELSLASLSFGQNILAENNSYKLILDKKEDLAGLPQSAIDGAAETAKELNMHGKWVFTLQNPSWIPFMTYSDVRELREKMYWAYAKRGSNGDDKDNQNNIKKIVNLRIEKAQLLGYKHHADYVLEESMAKNGDNVQRFLNELWAFTNPVAEREKNTLQELVYREGKEFVIEPWDWRYYAEKVRIEQYSLNEEELRPYFRLESVRNGIFQLVEKLFGLNFVENNKLPKYHPDATSYEVKKKDGSHVGVMYMDFHPRASKRGGAWMSSYREQYKVNGKNVTPIVTIVCNFSKPTSETPSLLTVDEVETFFHEFGHALHGLLSDCEYESLSGTSVPRDFVELPSQIMENWALEPEVLATYAYHYKTGEIIPSELVEKLQRANKFNQGFITAEYLAAALLDLKFHTLTSKSEFEPNKFEDEYLKSIGLIPQIISRYRSTYFNHIFSGGYSAGYYSYIWSGVLDSDAFEAFKEKGLYDYETAESFKKNILERGGTEDPGELYKKFRGREPLIDPLLRKRGLQ